MLAALVPGNIIVLSCTAVCDQCVYIALFILWISTFIYLFICSDQRFFFYDRATHVCDRGIVVARWHLVFSFLIIRRLHRAPHDNRGGLPAVPLH